MSVEAPVKALLVAFFEDVPAAVYAINRLKPENLCFFLPESAKPLVESSVQPRVAEMPRRWDWVVTAEPDQFMASYRAIAQPLSDMLRTWEVQPGELVLDMTDATPAMAAAMALAGIHFASRMVALGKPGAGTTGGGETVHVEGIDRIWTQGNPWDEAAVPSRREACELFNRGAFHPAGALFKQIESRVSGGQKPLYRALADLSEGYGLWERFQYRLAWEKLKAAHKALDMASVWGGPPGLKGLLPGIKQNAGFLEKLVLDPQEVKEAVALDLLAHARRRAVVDQHMEAAMAALLRALEAFAQFQLFKQYKMKTWDVKVEQLPLPLQEACRSCFLDDVDGKYKLPLHAQFQALAGLGNQMGQSYLSQWIKMKPLLDAAGHGVLGHGFEPLKAERFHQLHDIVVKMTGVSDHSLPKFPILNL